MNSTLSKKCKMEINYFSLCFKISIVGNWVLYSSIKIFPDVDGIGFVFIRLVFLKAVGRDNKQLTDLIDFVKFIGSASVNQIKIQEQ